MEPIPGPRGLPFIGNLLDIALDDVSLHAFERLADTYGPIYQLYMPSGKRIIVASSAEFMAELTDEKRFVKEPPGPLARPGAKGLFSARTDDPDWGQAHRILVPAFGPLTMEGMFDEMKDIASQLVLKWARKGPEHRIFATDDFTRLTLDTIALCAMDYRFNSFYQDSMHPFVDAMLASLSEGGRRSNRPAFINALRWSSGAKLKADRDYMRQVGTEIVNIRRSNPSDKKDLLNAMIHGVDPKTGAKLRDELIIAQMVGFLVAGHETTSGLLSFTFVHLLKNPAAYRKAQQEVDEVVGKESIQAHHLNKLKYVNAVLREALRLNPTAPMIVKKVNPSSTHETLGGKYQINRDDVVAISIGASQRDVHVYGEDANEFKPERMLDEEFEKLPPGAWRPFGNGVRACIGRPFAWQEALLVVAIILQNFDVQLDDPGYQMRIKQTLTVKPKDFYIKATLRNGANPTKLDGALHNPTKSNGTLVEHSVAKKNKAALSGSDPKPMTILYGSNTGTCQAFAQRLASDAVPRGFNASIMEMDSAMGKIPNDQPVIIITPSYEGQPADNAARFVEWLESLKGDELEGVNYAVFGCGHRDWAKTFHRIPKLTDQIFSDRKAHRVASIGLTDMAKGNSYGDFEDWLEECLWPSICDMTSGDSAVAESAAMEMEISTQARASTLRYDVSLGVVLDVKTLTADEEPPKCHMEVQLPTDTSYECGDYLAVLPLNPPEVVERVMSYFKLPWDAVITLKTTGPSTIPTNTPLSVYDVLRGYVELAQPATKKTLKTLASFTTSETNRSRLENLAADPTLYSSVLSKRTSAFDLLLQHPTTISIPFNEFLALLPPMRVRQYSISSSPLASIASTSSTCTITYAVIDQPSLSNPENQFLGVAGAYLHSLKKGDNVQISVRPTAKKTFRLPTDIENTPILMFCAGTGLAPFRGFVQQRAVQLEANPSRRLAPAVLFVGCRSETKDRLYADELDGWVKLGAVEVKYAFSREAEKSDGCGCVADRMVKERGLVEEMWTKGAMVYVCGSREFSKSVGEGARKLVKEIRRERGEVGEEGGKGEDRKEKLEQWFKDVVRERVAQDVFD